MAKQNKKSQKAIRHIKAQRGLDRQQFIDDNGDMKQWMPPLIIIQDKRKVSNKKACRGNWRG